ncbi:hypothetical protein BGZ65_004407 [Modicella reniformis]|uniref:Uncharacterized protein n=1 Tax=Modicella reniformis TaxID=1440133 RepID=A0A9P6IKL4_9FUNG|nr:hypothetical protein BGZ65_004407 [Modicella reniformis]
MRPDAHKQAASRKYQKKVRSRGGGEVGASGNTKTGSANHRGGGRGGARSDRGGGGGGGGGGRGSDQSRDKKDEQEEDTKDDELTDDTAPKKSYARRKIVSNADRYIERDEEVTEAEELEQGIDRQTIAFREMLKDSDLQKTFDPAAYFRFKSEKEVEAQDPAEESQQARKLLEIRLDDIEKALMTLSIQKRLYLQDSDARALDRDFVGKVSLSTGKPIIPKLVRGQAASDILIKYSTSSAATSSVATLDDDDLDDLLDVTTTYGRSRPSTAVPSKMPVSAVNQLEAQSSGSRIRLPPPTTKSAKPSGASATAVPKGPPTA